MFLCLKGTPSEYLLLKVGINIALNILMNLRLVIAILAFSAISSADPLEVFLVMGQSNAVGTRGDASLLKPDEADSQILFSFVDGIPNMDECTSESAGIIRLSVQDSPAKCLDKDKRPGGLFPYLKGFGPEMGLGRTLYKRGKRNFAIFKYAWSGSSLLYDWNPEIDWGSFLYTKFTAGYKKAEKDLQKQGYQIKVSGIFWMQGETDSSDKGMAREYKESLKAFIPTVRNFVGAPNAPFISGLIAPYNKKLNYWKSAKLIRQALTELSTATVETADLPVDFLRSGDGVHYNSEGLLTLGGRFAETYLSLPAH